MYGDHTGGNHRGTGTFTDYSRLDGMPRKLTAINEGTMYAERAYFDGDHCAHCAARDEQKRLERIAERCLVEQRRRLRAHGSYNLH